jgi:hypothetical protein
LARWHTICRCQLWELVKPAIAELYADGHALGPRQYTSLALGLAKDAKWQQVSRWDAPNIKQY